MAESSQNDWTVTSFSAFCKGDNELQVLRGIGCASYAKSLSGLALKCQNQDNVTAGWHSTLGCVKVGGCGWEFSCQNHYRPYIKKMPDCQESSGWKMSVWEIWLKPQPVCQVCSDTLWSQLHHHVLLPQSDREGVSVEMQLFGLGWGSSAIALCVLVQIPLAGEPQELLPLFCGQVWWWSPNHTWETPLSVELSVYR